MSQTRTSGMKVGGDVGMTPTEEGMAGHGARPHRRNKRLCVINKRPLCYIENAML